MSDTRDTIAMPEDQFTEERLAKYLKSSTLIESGNCPNECGKLHAEDWGQSCPVCNFSCNTLPNKENMQ